MKTKRREFLKAAAALAVTPVSPNLRALNPRALNHRALNDRASTQRANPDYLIVGAGSSGCALAYRLSENPAVRVAVIEAGVSGEADPAITTPGTWTALMGSAYDWGYRTGPEAGMGDRRIAFPRGKAHGGSSAINAMTFIRGDRRCFDRWRDLGNPGWGYEDVLPLFKRLEENETGASEYRGGEGPLAVSGCYDPHASHRAFLTAAVHTGYQSDARFDFNRPIPQGWAGYVQKNILDGKRHSAAAAFLVPAMARPNVEVRSRAHVTRLIIEGRRVVGVEYLQDGKPQQLRAAREVILAAGVIDSPALLMRSGIGPADHLKAHGIAVVADVPGVGGNLQDHLKLSIRWQGKTELQGSSVTAGLFTHSNPLEASTVPADLQFYLGRGLDQPDPFVTITVSLTRPRSRGHVRLGSADPLAAPVITANYLQEASDVRALARGVHLARFFAEQAVYEPLRGEELEPGKATTSDSDLERFIRRAADTIYHGAGTCRMGPGAEPMAVVDSALRVRGVEGLRVADASIMPEVVNAPTHAACVMIGEKAADLISRS
ncbi:MAG: FAD-dependent oxidoreductase [Acidobacteria bacterium]|nr:FAD-dependent oxidoreductase [Acidobacteriota bacterium]